MESMSELVLTEIENTILKLPVDEQRKLISRVSRKLRNQNGNDSDFKQQLKEMAADPDIQRELREIEADFRSTEFDGLAE